MQVTGFVACLLGVMVLAGCKSAGYVKSDTTAWSLQEAAGAARVESRNLGETMAALNGLVGSTSGDLRLQLQRYSRALDQLGTAKKRGDGAASRFARRSTDYFQAWDKQLPSISDEQLRKESMARKADVMGQYQTTSREHQDAQNSLAALIGYLKDIQKALSADLTTGGLQSVRPSVSNANEMADKVQRQLTQSATDSDGLGVRMSSLIGQSAK
jgi:hypothetical protein